MNIPRFPYERRVLEALEKSLSLERSLVVGFAGSLRELCELFEHLVVSSAPEIRQGRVVVAGFVNHTHHLLVGGLYALEQGNVHVWAGCARGLIETFGACVLIEQSPGIAPTFLGDRVKAGRLRTAAEKARPGLGSDVDRLNNIVHPASGAVHAGFRALDPEANTVQFHFGLRQLPADEAREGVTALANLAVFLSERLTRLSALPAVVECGKVIIRRTEPT